MQTNTTLSQTVEAWAEIVVKEWLAKARAMNVHDGFLLNSFLSHVISNSNGDPARVKFAFEWYGNMVNWGLGKGVSVGNKETMQNSGLTRRREKPFISDVFYKQLNVLRHILEQKQAMQMENFIVTNTSKN